MCGALRSGNRRPAGLSFSSPAADGIIAVVPPLWIQGLWLLAAYLLGAVPFGLLIARARGVDLRRIGSGNIGATNVSRALGRTWGILAFLLDALKGWAPAALLPLAARAAGAEPPDLFGVGCGVAAVVGHIWPVYLGFRGGKGVATSAGMLLGVAPWAALAGLAAWTVVFLSSRYVSLASIVAALIVPAAGWLLPHTSNVLPWILTALGLLTILRHRANIVRLCRGTENRFARKTHPASLKAG